MRDPPPAAAPDDGVAPFQVDCPTCGRDSDAPEATSLAGPLAPILDTAFLLCRINCVDCGTGFDRALWPVDPTVFSGVLETDEPEPEAAGLLARYEALEASYRQEWEALYTVASDESFGTRGIDLAGCPVAPRLDRPSAADPRLLAGGTGRAPAPHPPPRFFSPTWWTPPSRPSASEQGGGAKRYLTSFGSQPLDSPGDGFNNWKHL